MRTHESKSSLEVLACPARYYDRYVSGVEGEGGIDAAVGSAAHLALEKGIVEYVDAGYSVDLQPHLRAYDDFLLASGHDLIYGAEIRALLPGYLDKASMFFGNGITGVELDQKAEIGVRAIMDVCGEGELPWALDHKTQRNVPDDADLMRVWQTATTAAALYSLSPEAPAVQVIYGYIRYGCFRVCEVDRAQMERWLPSIVAAVDRAREVQRMTERPAPIPGKACDYCPCVMECAAAAEPGETPEELARLHVLYSEAAKRTKAQCKKLAEKRDGPLWKFEASPRLSAEAQDVYETLMDEGFNPADFMAVNTETCRKLLDSGLGRLVQEKTSVNFKISKGAL